MPPICSNSHLSPFDANERLEARHSSGKARLFRGSHDCPDVFVGPGRFFRDAAARRTAYLDAVRSKIIDDLATTPTSKRLMPGERTPSAMAGG